MERRCIKEMSGYAAFKEVQMKLNTSIYEKVKYKLTGNGDLSPALDAYAKAYFSEPPITGEWDEESMCEALYMILSFCRKHSAGSPAVCQGPGGVG